MGFQNLPRPPNKYKKNLHILCEKNKNQTVVQGKDAFSFSFFLPLCTLYYMPTIRLKPPWFAIIIYVETT